MNSSSGPAMRLMAGRTIGFAATLLIPLVLVRTLDASEFGTYKQIFLLFGTLFPLAQIGMAESLFYFLPSAQRRGGRFLVNASLALAVSGLACLLLLSGGRHLLASWMNNPRLADYIPLIGIYLLFMLVSAVLEITLIARAKYGAAALTYVASDLSRAALMLAPVLLFGNLLWLVYGAVAFAALRLLATLHYLRSEVGAELRLSPWLVKAQLAYAAPFQLAVVFEILQVNVHHFAVSYAYDTAIYAVYAVGCLQIPLIDVIASSVSNVLMVKMRAAAKSGDRHSVLQLWHAAGRDLALVLLPLSVFLIVIAGDFVTLLFTDAYAAAVPIFMIWTSSTVLSILQTDAFLRVHAETRFLARMNLLQLVLTIALLALLMPMMGLLGAVIATVTAFVAGKALALYRMRQLMQARLGALLPWDYFVKVGLATLAAAAPAALLMWGTSWARLPTLIAAAGCFWPSYLAAALYLDVVPDGATRVMAKPLQRWRVGQPHPALPRGD